MAKQRLPRSDFAKAARLSPGTPGAYRPYAGSIGRDREAQEAAFALAEIKDAVFRVNAGGLSALEDEEFGD